MMQNRQTARSRALTKAQNQDRQRDRALQIFSHRVLFTLCCFARPLAMPHPAPKLRWLFSVGTPLLGLQPANFTNPDLSGLNQSDANRSSNSIS
jgi:hypothetical protein